MMSADFSKRAETGIKNLRYESCTHFFENIDYPVVISISNHQMEKIICLLKSLSFCAHLRALTTNSNSRTLNRSRLSPFQQQSLKLSPPTAIRALWRWMRLVVRKISANKVNRAFL